MYYARVVYSSVRPVLCIVQSAGKRNWPASLLTNIFSSHSLGFLSRFSSFWPVFLSSAGARPRSKCCWLSLLLSLSPPICTSAAPTMGLAYLISLTLTQTGSAEKTPVLSHSPCLLSYSPGCAVSWQCSSPCADCDHPRGRQQSHGQSPISRFLSIIRRTPGGNTTKQ